jgi:hypothetical protein
MVRYYEVGIDPRFIAESDFVHRKRNGTVTRCIAYYMVGITALCCLYFVRDMLGNDLIYLVASVIVLLLLMFYSISYVQKNLDLVTSIEFQNALFSSAFREGKLFSMIVGNNDQMYYADPGFYRMFPDLAKRNAQVVDEIVKNSEHVQENLDKLNKAFVERTTQALDIFVQHDAETIKARMLIIPLPRPSGYFFVSARKFWEQRASDQYDALSPETLHVVNGLVSSMDDMTYVVNEQGKLVAASSAFLDLLEHDTMNDVIHKPVLELLDQPQDHHPMQFLAHNVHEGKHVVWRSKGGNILHTKVMHKRFNSDKRNHALILGKVVMA